MESKRNSYLINKALKNFLFASVLTMLITQLTTSIDGIIVSQRKLGELVALVHPDYGEARELGLTEENISNIMKLNAVDINEIIPVCEHIHHIEISENEFEKTAKRTIKRYLYK